MTIKNIAKKIVAPVALALPALGAWAQTITTTVVPDETTKTVKALGTKIEGYTKTAAGFIGVIAVVLLIYGAYLYVTAGTSEDNSKKAKSIILYAAIGIAVAMLSFVLVNVFISFF